MDKKTNYIEADYYQNLFRFASIKLLELLNQHHESLIIMTNCYQLLNGLNFRLVEIQKYDFSILFQPIKIEPSQKIQILLVPSDEYNIMEKLANKHHLKIHYIFHYKGTEEGVKYVSHRS